MSDLDEIEICRFGDAALIRARNDTRGTFKVTLFPARPGPRSCS